ncbi:MAG: hypothetical protein Q8Q60_00625 [Candidatus Chromulinivorax sp.]|nr:hypothetical protein [Candidatus Chromulinivorax sp.]
MKKISLLLILVLISLACSLLYVYNKYSSQNQGSKDAVAIQAMQTFKNAVRGTKKSTTQSNASEKYQAAKTSANMLKDTI